MSTNSANNQPQSINPEAPKTPNPELRKEAVIIGVLAGITCLCCMVGTAVMGYGVFTLNNRFVTELAPLRETQAVAVSQLTTAVAASATAEPNANAAATAFAQYPIVVSSTFDHNTEDWPAGGFDDAEYGRVLRQISDGKYQWEIEATQGVIWYGYPKMAAVTDFYLSVEANQTSEAGENYGVIFRRTSAGSYYFFGISPELQTFFLNLQHNDSWHTLLGRTYSPAIHSDAPNVITVIASGSTFTFFINGQHVAGYSDSTLPGGRAGVAVEVDPDGTASFEFDNFEVRAPTATPTPIRTPTLTATPQPTTTPASANLPLQGRIAFQSGSALSIINADGSGLYQIPPLYRTLSQKVSPKFDASPDWSPQGNRLIFAGSESENANIYTINPDGTNITFVTFTIYNQTDPAWSPDGRLIAFASDATGNQNDIYIIESTGSNRVRLTTELSSDTDPVWSPDNQHIVFVAYEAGITKLRIVSVDGSEPAKSIGAPEGANNPAWSPNGQWIVFASDYEGNQEIYLIRPDGSDLTRLTDNAFDDFDPTWSADGKHIAFVSNRDGQYDIYVMEADGSQPIRLTNTTAKEHNLAWGP